MPNPDPAKRFKYPFHFEGRRYSLYKQRQDAKAPWWIRAQFKGKQIGRSLDTPSGAAAAKRAIDSVLRPLKQQRWSEVPSAREETPQVILGQVLQVYEQKAGLFVKERTWRNNVLMLAKLVKTGLKPDAEVKSLPVSALTDVLVRNFLDRWLVSRLVQQIEEDRAIAGPKTFGSEVGQVTTFHQSGRLPD